HDQPAGGIARLKPGALDLEQRVAQLVGQPEDVVDLPAGIDGGDGGAIQRAGGGAGQNLMAPSGRDTPGKIRAPLERMLSAPTVTPSPSTAPPSMCVFAPIRAPAPRMQYCRWQLAPISAPLNTTACSIVVPFPTRTLSPSTAR